MKPHAKINCLWNPNLAYAIGLIATDGCLSSDGRHIDFTSNEKEQIENFMRCLGLKNKIGTKYSGYTGRPAFRIQFGDVLFYKFLLGVGLYPAKSKTIASLYIPHKYFFDFLRGAHDGDGTFYSYWDPRWKSSFMFYTVFISASEKHILWIADNLRVLLHIKGHITHHRGKSLYQLKYAKRESLKLLRKMYYSRRVVCLKRKRLKIKKALAIIGKSI